MAEIGLGEAIAGGTNLSGEFGSPFTRALATKEQNELRRLQIEEARAAKERAAAERVGRYLYKDDGKWFNPKNAEEFRKEYSMALPKMIAAERSRDIAGLTELQMNVQNKATYYKAKDEQERELQTSMPRFETARITDRILKVGGIQGIQEDAMLYPVPAAFIDESGIVRVNRIPDYNIDRDMKLAAKSLAQSAKLNKVKGASGLDVYETDMNAPEFKEAKDKIILDFMRNRDLMRRVMAKQEFKDFMDRYERETKIPREKLLGDNLIDVQAAFLDEKFNSNFKPRIKESRTRLGRSGGSGGGNSKSNIWTFTTNSDNSTLIETRSSGTPIISFKIQKGDKDELIELKSPEIVYNPTKEMFIVKGYNTQYGLNDPTSIEVSTEVIKNKFGLETDKEISEKFPSYRPRAAAPIVNVGGKNAPKSTEKPR